MDNKSRGSPTEKKSGSVSFLLSIHYSENHTWQGTIQWLETGQQINFRSELELLSLIKYAVQSVQIDKGKMRTWNDSKRIRSIK